jgi:hypothetical protein
LVLLVLLVVGSFIFGVYKPAISQMQFHKMIQSQARTDIL